MKDTVADWLALRRAAGFEMANAEYLLGSFARFAAERKETHVRTQTAIDWATQAASAVRRDERLKAVCRFARHVRVEMIVTSYHWRITLDAARRATCRTSIHPTKSVVSSKPPDDSVLVGRSEPRHTPL